MTHADPVLRKTFRISTLEGAFAQVYLTLSGPGSAFLTRFALMLGAGPVQLSLLAAAGQLAQVFQPLGTLLTRARTSRKAMVVPVVACGRAATFLFGLLPFVFFDRSVAVGVFLALFFLSASVQAAGGNAWIAWISDMVPLDVRGRFFSYRNRFLLVAGLVSGYFFGAVVDLFDPHLTWVQDTACRWFGWSARTLPGMLPAAFLGVFATASVMGLVSIFILRRQPERPKPVEKERVGELLGCAFRDRNFRILLIYGAWWMLALGIGAPFWQPFMIQRLGMSVVGIQVYGTLQGLAQIAVLQFWGRLIDRFGNKTAMSFAIVLSGINPLVWVFVDESRYWIVFLEAITSGFMWAGGTIMGTNFVLAVAPPHRRQIYSGIFGAVSGLACMVTMLGSGFLLPRPMAIGSFSLTPEQVLFGLTGVLRWTTLIPLAFVAEPAAKPLSAALGHYRKVARVRAARVAQWMQGGRRRSGR